MELGFCIKGEFEAKCKDFTFQEFPNEKDVIVLILEYFKTFLPIILKGKKDYYNKSIIIDPKDIDLMTQKDYGKYVAVISMTDDNSTYIDENFSLENTEYAFQIELQVVADGVLESFENMIKFRNAVKTLLVNMDKNLKLNTVIDSFSLEGVGGIEGSNKFVRQGTYRFSIQSTNYKQ